MAVNWELQLLASVLSASDRSVAFRFILDEGISLKHFGELGAVNVFSYINSHYTRPMEPGRVPSLEAVLEKFKNLDLPIPVEILEDLVPKVIGGWLTRKVDQVLDDHWDAGGTADDAISRLPKLLDELGALQEQHAAKNDVNWREVALQETIDDMAKIGSADGITGIPYPWPIMNEHTGGIQPGDMVLFWALPKSKKTWLGLYLAVFLFQKGYRVLIYSKEMTWENMRRRIGCILAGVSYSQYKDGSLPDEKKLAVLECIQLTVVDWFKGDLNFTDCDRPDGSVGGSQQVREKMETYKPDFVMCDSSYLLQEPGIRDASDWKAIDAILRNLKNIGKTMRIPILTIMQENEKAAHKYKGTRGTASIAMFAGIVMHCDVGIRLVNHAQLNQTTLHFAACRETAFKGFTIASNLCEDMAHIPGAPLWGIGDGDVEEEEEDTTATNEARTERAEFGSGASNRADRYGGGEPTPTTDEMSQDIVDAADDIDAAGED